MWIKKNVNEMSFNYILIRWRKDIKLCVNLLWWDSKQNKQFDQFGVNFYKL